MDVSQEHLPGTDHRKVSTPHTVNGPGIKTESLAVPCHFHSILFRLASDRIESCEAPECFRDLHLDQVIDAVTLGWKEYDLSSWFHSPLSDLDSILYRQQIMRDLQDDRTMMVIEKFSQQMRAMRQHLSQTDKTYYKYEKERWFLDAANLYCNAVERLAEELATAEIHSPGLIGFHDFLVKYIQSNAYKTLSAETRQLVQRLSAIRYCILIREGKYTVRRFEGESDYSDAVEQTFEKFRRGSVKDYLAELSIHAGMNHIQSQIMQGVARLYPQTFVSLQDYAVRHADYLNQTIARFDREVQFYIAYLQYVRRFRAAGLNFCFPQLSSTCKQIIGRDVFDIALAGKLVDEKKPVVTNEFSLRGAERIFVVSGPNQGGKTTFARTFGQLHYLAKLGCPVPGTEAKLFLFDHLFTHFEKEEDIENLRGKLHDDLVRIRQILDRATPRSIVIMNELFSSTTLKDALFLSKKIMTRISDLDLLGVWVTFLTEIAEFNEKTVSMVSTVDPHDPAIRTFKLERRPAEGVAYALAVAEKHRVTYKWVKERIKP